MVGVTTKGNELDMISDILSQAVEHIQLWLKLHPEAYVGAKPHIIALIEQMDSMRIELETVDDGVTTF